jgi:hypothetical protein
MVKDQTKIGCSDESCHENVLRMSKDLYDDNGIRDRALKSVEDTEFLKCKSEHKESLNDKIDKIWFWRIVSVSGLSILCGCLYFYYGLGQCADKDAFKDSQMEMAIQITSINEKLDKIDEIKTLLEASINSAKNDADKTKCKLDDHIDRDWEDHNNINKKK